MRVPPAWSSSPSSVSVVIGASRGLGLAFATALLQRSPGTVIGCARDPGSSPALQKLKEESGGRLHCLSADVTKSESLTQLRDVLAAEHGRVDLLLNVAGILHEQAEGGTAMPERSLRTVDEEWMARVFAVNAMGPVLCTQALQKLLKPGACVANLSARVGSIGDNRLGGWWSYRMSKAALNMATKNMANEMRRSEVLAVALHPGTTDTDLSKPFQANVKAEKLFTVEFTAGALLDVIEGLTPEDSGGFFAYDGSRIEY
tara:strand:- start:245 stop:1021 length:777 start_codon:yes stop_codon:yes gene_type:complete